MHAFETRNNCECEGPVLLSPLYLSGVPSCPTMKASSYIRSFNPSTLHLEYSLVVAFHILPLPPSLGAACARTHNGACVELWALIFGSCAVLGCKGRCVEGVVVLPWKSEGYCFVLVGLLFGMLMHPFHRCSNEAVNKTRRSCSLIEVA
jgi:hypothetical protein